MSLQHLVLLIEKYGRLLSAQLVLDKLEAMLRTPCEEPEPLLKSSKPRHKSLAYVGSAGVPRPMPHSLRRHEGGMP